MKTAEGESLVYIRSITWRRRKRIEARVSFTWEEGVNLIASTGRNVS